MVNYYGATVSQYATIAGATINAALVNDNQGLNFPTVIALDAPNNHLFVYDTGIGTLSEFDATSGATIKFHFAALSLAVPAMVADNTIIFSWPIPGPTTRQSRSLMRPQAL